MKPSYDEPKIKPKNKINLENKNDKEKSSVENKTTDDKASRYGISAWTVFTVILLVIAVYQYYAFDKTLHASSLTFLVAFVYALHRMLNVSNKINKYDENHFIIRLFRAKKILFKAKKLVNWLETIKTWQRFIIFFSFFIIGYLLMIM